jgi:hypothetical protein
MEIAEPSYQHVASSCAVRSASFGEWHAFCFIQRSVVRERQLFDAAMRAAAKT